jgi:streptogramin lyase
MVKDVLGVTYFAAGYDIQCVLPSAFGLPKQLALLPDGDILITDVSFKRILVLSNGNIHTLVGPDEVDYPNAVAAMSDGRVAYKNRKNLLVLIEPRTGAKTTLGTIPPYEQLQTLTADSEGGVYAVVRSNKLFHFAKDGTSAMITSALPFEQIETPTISDIDVGQDGTIYISGFKYFVSVSPKGDVKTITDDLHGEPSWVEVAPDGKVYVKDIASGVRWLNPTTGELISVRINIDTGVSDLLALSADEFIFFGWGTQVIYRYNLSTKEATPLFVNAVNSAAFATDKDAFLAAPGVVPFLKSRIIRIQDDGTTRDVPGSTFASIQSADIDKEGRLWLYADNNFYRLEADGLVTSITPNFLPGEKIGGNTNIAIGTDGIVYCISTDPRGPAIRLWTVDKGGKVTILPITFNLASFGNAYKLSDARIDISADDKLFFIVTALGSKGQGPYYQRVYQADGDGSNMTEIANFDSGRVGGMVDVTTDHDNVFVLICEGTTGGGETIYRLRNNGEISKLLGIRAGRDPKSIDVDSKGNVWVSTTVGVFKVTLSK